jgi:hypothetical protein
MNNSDQQIEERVYLTVAEYAQHFNMSENTVRTRINRNKLQTIRIEREGREVICIPVSHENLHAELGGHLDEQLRVVQGTVQNEEMNHSASPDEWLGFVRETFQTLENYSGQLVELSRENERYKLLSDGSHRQLSVVEQEIEQLKARLFEKEARIKELEEKLAQKDKGWRFW